MKKCATLLFAFAAILGAQQTVPPTQTPYVNFTTGLQFQGSFGINGNCAISNGSGTYWGSCPGGLAGVTADGLTPPGIIITGNGAGSTAIPLRAYSLAAWGDSLTAGGEGNTNTGDWPDLFSALSGYQNYNGGVAGQTSTQIATRFLADVVHPAWFQVIEAGRNNYLFPSTVLTDIASMVTAMPAPKSYLVLNIISAITELPGGSNYIAIQSLNSSLASAYPNNFVDVWTPTLAYYNAGNLLDVYDHSQGVTASSIRAESVATVVGSLGSSGCSFTISGSSVTPTPPNEALIDSEYIYITASSGQNVTACTRGYASSTATTHLAGAAFTLYDNLHLNAAGYQIWANTIWAKVQTMPNVFVRAADFSTVLANNLPVAVSAAYHMTSGNYVKTNTDTSFGLYASFYALFQSPGGFNFADLVNPSYGTIGRAGDGSMHIVPTNYLNIGGNATVNGTLTATNITALNLPSSNILLTNGDTSLNLSAPNYLYLKTPSFKFNDITHGDYGTLTRAGDGSMQFTPSNYFRISGGFVGTSYVNAATFQTATNCSVNSASPAACVAAASGAVVVPTTTTTYTVNTSAVTTHSRVFLQPLSYASDLPSSPTCVAPAITSVATISGISNGTSFTFALPSTTGQTCWSFWIVN